MPTVSISALSVAANAKSAEQLAGTQIGYSPKSGMLYVYPVGSATGLNMTLQIGSEVVVDDQPISGANRFPLRTDDLYWSGQVAQGEQIRLFFRNTTGGALTVNGILDLK